MHICIHPCAYVTLKSLLGVQTLTFPRSQSLTTQWVVYPIHVMNDVHIPSFCRLTNTQCNFQWVSKSRVTPKSYHSTLSLRDNYDRVSSLGQQNFSTYTTSLLHPHRNSGYLHGSLTPTQKFRISPQVSYTHTEILDISTGILQPYRNFEYLHGPLTPTQKFRISPRVSYTHIPGSFTPTQKFGISPRFSYTHTEISDISTGLLYSHRNLGYLPGSLTPTQKFWISPRVSYIHT